MMAAEPAQVTAAEATHMTAAEATHMAAAKATVSAAKSTATMAASAAAAAMCPNRLRNAPENDRNQCGHGRQGAGTHGKLLKSGVTTSYQFYCRLPG
ncbi:MAG TPA: hypothetical protein VF306_21105 [Pirellulales bacterium]